MNHKKNKQKQKLVMHQQRTFKLNLFQDWLLALVVRNRIMAISSIISNLFIKNVFKNCERNISIFASLNREFRKNKRQNIVIKEDKVPQERSFEVGPAWIKYAILSSSQSFCSLA